MEVRKESYEVTHDESFLAPEEELLLSLSVNYNLSDLQ